MIRNTQDASDFEKLVTALPGGIERQEAAGQRQLVADSALPSEGLLEVAAQLGITVIGPRTGDSIFSDVTLPAGWKLQATEHPMWSSLIDETGHRRADIFYKAAFYDRRAFIRTAKGCS